MIMSFSRPILSDNFPIGIAKNTDTMAVIINIKGIYDSFIPVSAVLTSNKETEEFPRVNTKMMVRKK
jgi:hypothetical protein